MGAVATEKDRGTAAFVLSKTASRGGFLRREGVSIGLVLAVVTVLGVAVGWIYTAILFEPMPVAGWVAMAVLAWLGVAVWAAITFLASTVTGSAAAAAGVGFVALLVLSIVGAIPTVARFLPAGLAEPAIALATGPARRLPPTRSSRPSRPRVLIGARPAGERVVVPATRSSDPRTQTTPRERSAAIASAS